jgi:hypothetical protein
LAFSNIARKRKIVLAQLVFRVACYILILLFLSEAITLLISLVALLSIHVTPSPAATRLLFAPLAKAAHTHVSVTAPHVQASLLLSSILYLAIFLGLLFVEGVFQTVKQVFELRETRIAFSRLV